MENELQQDALVSVINNDEEIIVQFADGKKVIPEWIVEDLGKPYFIDRAEAFVRINYADFYAGYQKTIEKRLLNQIQNDFIADHFGKHS